jgi:hypothetical protein
MRWYGATTMMSSGLRSFLVPSVFSYFPFSRSSIRPAILSASSVDERVLPSWVTGMYRTPVPVSSPGASMPCLAQPAKDSRRPSYIASEMNRHTSGCIRLVSSMNRPRSGGIVVCSWLVE